MKTKRLKIDGEIWNVVESTPFFFKAEKEIVTSGADAENGTYESVTKTECVADSTQDVQHTRVEALPKRIDSENRCACCLKVLSDAEILDKYCGYCGNELASMEES